MLQPTALIVGIYKEFLSFHLIDTVRSAIVGGAAGPTLTVSYH